MSCLCTWQTALIATSEHGDLVEVEMEVDETADRNGREDHATDAPQQANGGSTVAQPDGTAQVRTP